MRWANIDLYILKSHNVLQDGQYVEVMNKREMEMIRWGT